MKWETKWGYKGLHNSYQYDYLWLGEIICDSYSYLPRNLRKFIELSHVPYIQYAEYKSIFIILCCLFVQTFRAITLVCLYYPKNILLIVTAVTLPISNLVQKIVNILTVSKDLVFLDISYKYADVWLAQCYWIQDPVTISLPGSSIHIIFPTRILNGLPFTLFEGSSWPRTEPVSPVS